MIKHDKSLKVAPSYFKQSNCKYIKILNNIKRQLSINDFNTVVTIISKVRKDPFQFKNMRPRIIVKNKSSIKLFYTKNNFIRIKLEESNSHIMYMELCFNNCMQLRFSTNEINDLVNIISLGLNNMRIYDF